MACTEIPYVNPDGSVNPAGGYCAEDLIKSGGVVNSGGGVNTAWNILIPQPDRPTYPPNPPTYTGQPSGAGPGSRNMPLGYANIVAPPTWLPPNTPTIPLSGSGSGPCTLVSNPIARWACEKAVAEAEKRLGGGNNNNTGLAPGCPAGYESDGRGGCKIKGVGSYLPGDVGNPDTGWTPVNGMYGVGRTPLPVQRTVRACPGGWVLGKDGVCYDGLPRGKRAHNPGAKPMLTGGDMNALRRAHQLKKAITKINRRFGTKPAKQCAPKRKSR